MKLHKILKGSNGNDVKLYGDDEWVEIEYGSDATDDCIAFVHHQGENINLDEFIRTHKNPWCFVPEWMKEFSGYHKQTMSSGLVIAISDCGDAAKVFTYTV